MRWYPIGAAVGSCDVAVGGELPYCVETDAWGLDMIVVAGNLVLSPVGWSASSIDYYRVSVRSVPVDWASVSFCVAYVG